MQVHHIGYLVEDMAEAVKEFARLGYRVQKPELYDSLRRINLCFVENEGTCVELIEPAEGCKLFTKLHKRIGNAPYHIGYITDGGGGLDETLTTLCDEGYMLVQPPQPATAFGEKRVAFLMNEAIGLIEIIES